MIKKNQLNCSVRFNFISKLEQRCIPPRFDVEDNNSSYQSIHISKECQLQKWYCLPMLFLFLPKLLSIYIFSSRLSSGDRREFSNNVLLKVYKECEQKCDAWECSILGISMEFSKNISDGPNHRRIWNSQFVS